MVLEEMPYDPTDLEDAMHAALFRGKPIDAVHLAAQHDLWLSAHLADVLERSNLLDADVDDEYVHFFVASLTFRYSVSSLF